MPAVRASLAAQRGQRGEVLPGGERGVEAGTVHEAGDAVGGGERPPDRRTQDLQAAAVGDGQAEQQAEQGRLAGAVRPDQAVDLALRHIQVDAVECDDITEALGDPAGPDRERCVHEGNLWTPNDASRESRVNVGKTADDRHSPRCKARDQWPGRSALRDAGPDLERWKR